MKKALVIAALCAALVGCGDEKPSDKVMKFIDTQDMWMLSKSKTSMCTDTGLKKIHLVNENALPSTNKYYNLSKYLHDNISYEVVGESKSGENFVVAVKQVIPKALIDAKFFAYTDPSVANGDDINGLDNLKSLYDNGDLKKLDYAESIREWIVLPDGIDPELSDSQKAECS